jgi:Icc-related predicted phosphoesterase
MIIDCISDLHGHYPKLDSGDLLIVAGDLTARDQPLEHLEFIEWLCKQDYKKKVFILGNHDNVPSPNPHVEDPRGFSYLCDSGTEFCGTDIHGNSRTIKIWGSPWTKRFDGMNPHCMAFTCETEDELYDKFIQIPSDTDILITHGPPYGILDVIPIMYDGTLYHAGSHALFNWLKYVGRPLVHVFGHIHEGYGQKEYFVTHDDKMMKSINCSHVNERYKPVNKPIRIEL